MLQVINRDKLQRAGEDNLFVRLLFGKDKPQPVKNQDEQEKLGIPIKLSCGHVCIHGCISRCIIPQIYISGLQRLARSLHAPTGTLLLPGHQNFKQFLKLLQIL